MALTRQVSQYARARLVRRLSRSMPWIGGLVAIAAIGTAIRRKGLIGGAVDTALDVIPGVGAVKNARLRRYADATSSRTNASPADEKQQMRVLPVHFARP